MYMMLLHLPQQQVRLGRPTTSTSGCDAVVPIKSLWQWPQPQPQLLMCLRCGPAFRNATVCEFQFWLLAVVVHEQGRACHPLSPGQLHPAQQALPFVYMQTGHAVRLVPPHPHISFLVHRL
mmetsp:Transcript_2340/g.6197  ORF Transcript_2340/g.6197 Transcript_2340/m.6197 type:complete len:121 (+) Transcript_2340:1579-1941(+)